MHKKLGPLELWQWVALGLVVGLGTYLFEKYKTNQANSQVAATPGGDTSSGSTSAGVPSDTGAGGGGSGPVDNTTGTDTSAGSTDTGGGQTSGGSSIEQELADLGAIQSLEQGYADMTSQNGVAGGDTNQGTEAQPPNVVVNILNKAKRKAPKPPGGHHGASHGGTKATQNHQPKRQRTGSNNPGHVRQHNGNGTKQVTSSAPHNPQQHKSVAPPEHQQHTQPKPSVHAGNPNKPTPAHGITHQTPTVVHKVTPPAEHSHPANGNGNAPHANPVAVHPAAPPPPPVHHATPPPPPKKRR